MEPRKKIAGRSWTPQPLPRVFSLFAVCAVTDATSQQDISLNLKLQDQPTTGSSSVVFLPNVSCRPTAVQTGSPKFVRAARWSCDTYYIQPLLAACSMTNTHTYTCVPQPGRSTSYSCTNAPAYSPPLSMTERSSGMGTIHSSIPGVSPHHPCREREPEARPGVR